MRIDRITTRDALERLRPEWDDLWARTQNATPFQHSAWILPWWDVFGEGRPTVLTLRDGHDLVAIAPLYCSYDAAGRSELRLMGAGISDYLDVLAAPGAESAVIAALTCMLTGELWVICAFDHVRPGSPLLDVKAPAGAIETTNDDEPCPALPLPDSADALSIRFGTHLNKELRYRRRRADRLGAVVLRPASPESLDEMLSALFELHSARWQEKGERGVFGDRRVRVFHRLTVPALLSAGVLRMHALSIDGRIVAVYYGLHAADRAFFYVSGFDPTFSSISPGKLVVATAIERAVMDGASVFDFLGGREAYKYEWNATDQPRVNRYINRLHEYRRTDAP